MCHSVCAHKLICYFTHCLWAQGTSIQVSLPLPQINIFPLTEAHTYSHLHTHAHFPLTSLHSRQTLFPRKNPTNTAMLSNYKKKLNIAGLQHTRETERLCELRNNRLITNVNYQIFIYYRFNIIDLYLLPNQCTGVIKIAARSPFLKETLNYKMWIQAVVTLRSYFNSIQVLNSTFHK